MPVSLSAIIITKNEQRNIRRCLSSVRDIVDEIIVVDSYSTDQTETICREFPKVKFHQRKWVGYSQTKNYANSLASGDFLLSLDADEELSPELSRAILAIREELTPGTQEIYAIDRLTNYCGQWIWHSGWRPDYQFRLFPREKAHWDGAEVHEALKPASELVVKRVKAAYLFHYSYYSIEEHIARVNKYSSLGAEKIVRKNKKALIARAIFNAVFRFFKAFILKRGFLDGTYGLVIAVVSAYAVFLKYAKAYQLKRR